MGHPAQTTTGEPFNTVLADAMQRALGSIAIEDSSAPATKAKATKSSSRPEKTEPVVDGRLAALGAKKPIKARKPHSVIHLAKPPIDKIATHTLLNRANGNKELKVLGFHPSKECDSKQMIAWISKGIWPIDIGSEKYHTSHFPSTFAMTLDFLEHTPTVGEAALERLLAENNRTGHLKNGDYAIPGLLRDFYELPGVDAKEVIERAEDVVKAWLLVHDMDEALPCFVDLEETFEGITDINRHGHFSLGQYIRHLYVLGIEREELIRRWNWWAERKFWVERAKAQAEKTYAKSKFPRHDIGDGKQVLVIESDDSWLVRAVGRGEKGKPNRKRAHLSIVRTSSGLVSILLIHRGLDISNFVGAVMTREPDLWYFQPVMGALMNGSVQYQGNRPTKLSVDELIELLRQHPPVWRKRK